MLSLKQELSACSKWWTSLMSPNLDIGLWTSNCWMSLLTELAPCHRVESFCHAVTSRFRSVNMRSTLALNSSIIIGILEGLRTCWILCVAHVPVALPFMYDRINSIQLVLSGDLDPHRHMYRLHSALKQSRSSCRPVNGVGVAIFRSLVVVGSGGGSTGGDGDWALSWFCSTWICCVSSVTCSSLRKVNMCKYPPIGSIIILPDDVYKSSKIMLPKEGLCL